MPVAAVCSSGSDSEKRPLLLMVEDDVDIRRLTSIILRDRFRVEEAPDGAAGLRLARELRPDVILLDIYMEGLSGYDVCRALKADSLTTGIPVAIYTVGANPREVEKGYQAGADDYIIKPFDTDNFVSRLEKLLAN